ncbi:hypothetical protein O6H91_05G087300 [Diphasiastrum complanatum]|uniref:Uncharacterized protein n=4 Tax=Diphasiastrum complanatum TaxID=34168 RepID=A0ACC2DQS6_DIPCM|nr:hypothetical protein O6H91_05G087300 [Diphasiastrum complanatum]KAJ7556524.1 hypothetical protein O6H91_05G087300 [Diphasiastrum complanatum]KAJ7556525.1 hypothetical protein O6H91_05G087300 [Diphasiastrum complanatum]KAJ7556526.1 hypothetical protein O6H91_05G087300 [Diphasiastrum complanatum]
MNAFQIISMSPGLDLSGLFQKHKMKLQGDKMGRKGYLSLSAEIFEVASSLHMVELRKLDGDTLEYHKFEKNLSTGLKDIVWLTEVNIAKSIDKEKQQMQSL